MRRWSDHTPANSSQLRGAEYIRSIGFQPFAGNRSRRNDLEFVDLVGNESVDFAPRRLEKRSNREHSDDVARLGMRERNDRDRRKDERIEERERERERERGERALVLITANKKHGWPATRGFGTDLGASDRGSVTCKKSFWTALPSINRD